MAHGECALHDVDIQTHARVTLAQPLQHAQSAELHRLAHRHDWHHARTVLAAYPADDIHVGFADRRDKHLGRQERVVERTPRRIRSFRHLVCLMSCEAREHPQSKIALARALDVPALGNGVIKERTHETHDVWQCFLVAAIAVHAISAAGSKHERDARERLENSELRFLVLFMHYCIWWKRKRKQALTLFLLPAS